MYIYINNNNNNYHNKLTTDTVTLVIRHVCIASIQHCISWFSTRIRYKRVAESESFPNTPHLFLVGMLTYISLYIYILSAKKMSVLSNSRDCGSTVCN